MRKKLQISIKKLTSGLPDKYFQFFTYIKSLEFSQRPDYKLLKSFFLNNPPRKNSNLNDVSFIRYLDKIKMDKEFLQVYQNLSLKE